MQHEFGIVWESDYKPPKRHSGDHRDMGITVFESYAARDAAEAWLRELGYTYFTRYEDTQGPGLCWGWGMQPVRPSVRDRLPSVQRNRRFWAAHDRFQAGLYKNPHYDSVH